MAAPAAAAPASAPPMAAIAEDTVTINVNRFRAIFRAFEEDEEIGAAMTRLGLGINIRDEGQVQEAFLPEIPASKITAILNNIDSFRNATPLFQADHMIQVVEFSNLLLFRNADMFKQQVIYAFYKLVQQKTLANPRKMDFDEVKMYLTRLMDIPELGHRTEMLMECKAIQSPYKQKQPIQDDV